MKSRQTRFALRLPALRIVLLFVAIIFCRLSAAAAHLATLEKVVNPHCLRAYDGRLYLLEDGTVHVFNGETGAWIHSFGRTGEGPGETRRFPSRGNMLRINDRGVFIDAREKIVWFDWSGRLIREFHKPYGHFVVEPLEDGWVSLYRETTPTGIILTVTRCSDDFTVRSRYITSVSKASGFSLFPDPINFVAAGETFYVEDSQRGFVISQYHLDGHSLRTLGSRREPVEVSPEDIQFAWSELAADPETQMHGGLDRVRRMLGITVPRTFPPIKELSADRAHLFVKTFARKDGDCEFLVFNHQGRALGRVDLPVTPADAFDDYLTGRLDRYYAFEGDFFYFLRENEAEEAWELHRVRWRDKIQNL
ncbi:MAG: hypothetical protein RB296_06025 [Acidobacteriota bacterium]|nr:hypothetical protein [Acidobacteriota bacterium]